MSPSSSSRGKTTVRVVPPSPALSLANLEAWGKGRESLSSVYSRSISGESRGPGAGQEHGVQRRLGWLSETGRTVDEGGSVVSVRRGVGGSGTAVVGVERLGVGGGEVRGGDVEDDVDDDGDSSIDDGVALRARLKGLESAEEGWRDEAGWRGMGDGNRLMSYELRVNEKDAEGRLRRLDFTPLHVRKTRGSGAKFGGGVV